MDKSAIQAIADLAKAEGAIYPTLLENYQTMVIANDHSLKSLEHLNDKPNLFRGYFRTTLLQEFIEYVGIYADFDSKIFIDNTDMSALVIIDQGSKSSPQWGKHRAELSLLKTSAYVDLLTHNNKVLSQQDLIDFCEDWQTNIGFYYDDEALINNTISFEKTIKTLRKLKLNAASSKEQEIKNYSANQSTLESIEITAANEQLPAGFIFSVIAYDGFEAINFNCQLRAISDDKSVKLKYRVHQLTAISEKIAGDFREQLRAGILNETDEVGIFIGKMIYQA